MEDFNTLLLNHQSVDSIIRSNAETQLNAFLERGEPYDLDLLFQSLNKDYDNRVKLFLCILIKKVFDSCINQNNINRYREYIALRKGDIINTILNIKADLKSLNFLVLILGECLNLFKDFTSAKDLTDNTTNVEVNNNFSFHSHSSEFNPDEIFGYIFEFYNFNKSSGNVLETFQGLFISFKLLKYLKNWEDKDKYDYKKTMIMFYDKIIIDFSEILNSFLAIISNNTGNLSSEEYQNLEILSQYINLYFKMAKHSINFLLKEQREKIMFLTFEFLQKILFRLVSNSKNSSVITSSSNIFSNAVFVKNLFESIFTANKMLLKYTGYVSKLDIATIKKFSDLFYVYISEQGVVDCIREMIRSNPNENSNRETKFLTDIIDFFRELLQLTSFDNWGDLLFFKNCYSDDSIKISDYLTKDFFTEERYKSLIIFTIKNCMGFRISEIELAMSDVEEFYTWYDTLSPVYDLREKAGLLARMIYEKNKKTLKDFYENLEINLLNLTDKELLQLSEGGLNFEETNLKCSLLYFFEAMAYIYFNKHRNYKMWIERILLQPLDVKIIVNCNLEIFSRFIMMRLLMKTIDYKEVSEFRCEIFMKVYEIFQMINNNKNNTYLLLKLASVDFFYAYFDDIYTREFPDGFLQNYILHACELLKNVSSPDIHNKIIKTTLTILNKFKDEEIEFSFPHIFPIINILWENNWTDYSNMATQKVITKKTMKTINSISVVRQNLVKLIAIFVKKIGIFIKFNSPSHSHTLINETNNTNLNSMTMTMEMNNIGAPVDINYFNFIYNIIGYSISIKSDESNFLIQEALKLILLIQDEFYKLNCIKKNLSPDKLEKSNEFSLYFTYYFKIYDFLPFILENLSISDDYFVIQFLIIEQYISLISIGDVKNYLISINYVDKVIYIIKLFYEKHIMTYHQPIFNFIEYNLYMLNSIGMWEYNQKFNEFTFQMVENILSNFNGDEVVFITEEKEKENAHGNEIQQIPQLQIMLGGLQLSNRLIFINCQFGIMSNDFYIKLLNYLNYIFSNKSIQNFISLLNRKILSNLLNNLKKIFQSLGHGDQIGNINISDMINYINNGFKSHYLDKSDHTLNHWLFFFNKMNNTTYYYNFSAVEDKMRHFWTSKFEKTNYFDADLSDVVFEFKYYYLLNDTMYKSENDGDE
jgi:hypothetical protein